MCFRCVQEPTLTVALSQPADPGLHSCHLRQSSASYVPMVGERVHSFLLHLLNKGRGEAQVGSQLRQVPQVTPTAVPLTGHPRCCRMVPELGTHFTTIHHFLPSYAGTDSLLHDEGKSSPKSSIIPRLPLSAVHQARVMCQPLWCRGVKPFFQQTLQTPCELQL